MGLETPSGGEPRDAHVGRKAVDLGLITAHQLAEALQQLSSAPAAPNKPTSLSAALVSRGLLTERQVEVLVEGSAAPKRVGKYRVARELGRGGMGVVYEAEDQELHRRVALKMLLSSFQADPREAAGEEERFIRESRLSANLPKHPHIVGVYEAGIVEGRRYIAMEYIEGRQFSDWRHDKAVTVRQQIAVLRDVALAVDHAHRHGVIHRDLKPQNILVDAERQPHVTDFGLAKRANGPAAASLTISGQIMGTPAYMSPEQAEGRKDVDRRSDVWALGVMLYEVLAGRLPFMGGTPLDILMKTVKEPVRPPSTVLRGGAPPVDRALENICLKALAKNPRERYAGAAGMADDLDRWLKGRKVGASAPRKKLPRSWILAGAAAVVVAIVLVVAMSPTPDDGHDHAARARDYVAQGHALLQKGRYTDAIVAFHRAAEEDPGSRAAAAGKKEAEEKLVAVGRRDDKPAPVPAKVDSPPPPSAAEDVARKESERRARVEKELAELDLTQRTLRGTMSFGSAREVLLQAALRHEDADWKEAVTARLNELKGAVAAALGPIKERAVAAKSKGDAAAVEALRARVKPWNWPEASIELDEAVAKVEPPLPPVVPPPPPVPPPTAGAVERPELRAHHSGIHVMAFLPDDRTILTASFDQAVRLWDLETRQKRKELVAPGVLPVSGAASLDGRWIAAGLFDSSFKVWDVEKLQLRAFNGHAGQVTGAAFTPDGKLAATSSVDGMVRIWDVASGAPKFTSAHLFPKGAMCLGLSHDGKSMAAGGAEEGLVRVFDVPSGKERKRFDDVNAGCVDCVALSPDGRWLLTGGRDLKVTLIELSSGRRKTAVTFNTAGKHVRSVGFTPDGKWALAASSEGTLVVFDAATGAPLATFKDGGGFFSAVFSRKGDLLAAGTGGGAIRVWDLRPLRSSK